MAIQVFGLNSAALLRALLTRLALHKHHVQSCLTLDDPAKILENLSLRILKVKSMLVSKKSSVLGWCMEDLSKHTSLAQSGAAQLLQSNRPGDRAAAEGGICTEKNGYFWSTQDHKR
jgi:hypothetical protein